MKGETKNLLFREDAQEDVDQDQNDLVEEAGLSLCAEAKGVILKEVHCSAHPLQLAVEDSLTESTILDCPTRWHSIYDMLECLLKLMDFCQGMTTSDHKLHLIKAE